MCSTGVKISYQHLTKRRSVRKSAPSHNSTAVSGAFLPLYLNPSWACERINKNVAGPFFPSVARRVQILPEQAMLLGGHPTAHAFVAGAALYDQIGARIGFYRGFVFLC
jgi:hypothetical protein